jgi:hypothetical protein
MGELQIVDRSPGNGKQIPDVWFGSLESPTSVGEKALHAYEIAPSRPPGNSLSDDKLVEARPTRWHTVTSQGLFVRDFHSELRPARLFLARHRHVMRAVIAAGLFTAARCELSSCGGTDCWNGRAPQTFAVGARPPAVTRAIHRGSMTPTGRKRWRSGTPRVQ